MPERPRTEPSADHRAAAVSCWQMFIALTDQGFTEMQALHMVGVMMTASIQRGTDG